MARSVAAALYPHLAEDRLAPRERPRHRDSRAETIWPGLAPPKPKPVDYQREILLRNLREINDRHRRYK
jgi:hypothetical protein